MLINQQCKVCYVFIQSTVNESSLKETSWIKEMLTNRIICEMYYSFSLSSCLKEAKVFICLLQFLASLKEKKGWVITGFMSLG